MASEAPAPALYSAPLGGPGHPVNRGLYPHPTCRPRGPLSDARRRRRSSLPQGQPWGWRLLSWWSLRPGWRPGVVVFLQSLDRDHRHVAGPDPECLSPPGTGPPNCASLWLASDAFIWRARCTSGSAPAPAPGEPHLDVLIPAGWRLGQRLPRRRFQHHGDDPSFLRLGDRLWCLLPHHSLRRHALSLPSPSFPSSLLDRCWERLRSTSHLSRCLGSPWAVLSQRRSRSSSYHS
jgi:hypothetical protein